MQEFEAHFLNIDPDKTEKQLYNLGAFKVSDLILKETIFDDEKRTWNKIHKRVRIRVNGSKAELSYKEQTTYNQMGGTIEFETEISDPENMKLILEKLGLIAVRTQEKRRITYKLNDIAFDIDFWPQIPPFLEIESDSEERVKSAAESLGFKWQDACFLDAKQILEEIYKIENFNNVKIFTFDKFERY